MEPQRQTYDLRRFPSWQAVTQRPEYQAADTEEKEAILDRWLIRADLVGPRMSRFEDEGGYGRLNEWADRTRAEIRAGKGMREEARELGGAVAVTVRDSVTGVAALGADVSSPPIPVLNKEGQVELAGPFGEYATTPKMAWEKSKKLHKGATTPGLTPEGKELQKEFFREAHNASKARLNYGSMWMDLEAPVSPLQEEHIRGTDLRAAEEKWKKRLLDPEFRKLDSVSGEKELEEMSREMQTLAREFHQENEEDWAASPGREILTDLQNVQMLKSYQLTRNPAYYDALMDRLTKSAVAARADARMDELRGKMEDRGMPEWVQAAVETGSEPLEIASNGLVVLASLRVGGTLAKTLQTANKTNAGWKLLQDTAGMAGSVGLDVYQERLQAAWENPLISEEELDEVTREAFKVSALLAIFPAGGKAGFDMVTRKPDAGVEVAGVETFEGEATDVDVRLDVDANVSPDPEDSPVNVDEAGAQPADRAHSVSDPEAHAESASSPGTEAAANQNGAPAATAQRTGLRPESVDIDGIPGVTPGTEANPREFTDFPRHVVLDVTRLAQLQDGPARRAVQLLPTTFEEARALVAQSSRNTDAMPGTRNAAARGQESRTQDAEILGPDDIPTVTITRAFEADGSTNIEVRIDSGRGTIPAPGPVAEVHEHDSQGRPTRIIVGQQQTFGTYREAVDFARGLDPAIDYDADLQRADQPVSPTGVNTATTAESGRPSNVDLVKNTGPLGGKLATTRQIRAAERELREMGMILRLDFEGHGGKFGWTDPKAPYVSLPERPTEIQLFHELTHARQYHRLGRKKYAALGELAREEYVYDKVVKSGIFNAAELADAERVHTESAGEIREKLINENMETFRISVLPGWQSDRPYVKYELHGSVCNRIIPDEEHDYRTGPWSHFEGKEVRSLLKRLMEIDWDLLMSQFVGVDSVERWTFTGPFGELDSPIPHMLTEQLPPEVKAQCSRLVAIVKELEGLPYEDGAA